MDVVNQATIDAITRGFRVIFNSTLQKAPNRIDEIATRVPSTTLSQDFPIGGLLGHLREWKGDRVIRAIAAWSQNVVNKDFEMTVAVTRNSILDDSIGVYDPQIQNLAGQAAEHPWKEAIAAVMTDGFSVTGFDGAAFFSATHTWPGGYSTAQDNLTDELLDAAAIKTGIEAMMNYRGPDGEPLDAFPTHFFAGHGLWDAARGHFTVPDPSAQNTLQNVIEPGNIIIDPRVPAKKWALLDCSKPVKPIINQRRKEPELVSQTDSSDEPVFNRKEYVYGVDYRGRVLPIGWWLAYGSDGSGS